MSPRAVLAGALGAASVIADALAPPWAPVIDLLADAATAAIAADAAFAAARDHGVDPWRALAATVREATADPGFRSPAALLLALVAAFGEAGEPRLEHLARLGAWLAWSALRGLAPPRLTELVPGLATVARTLRVAHAVRQAAVSGRAVATAAAAQARRAAPS